MKQIDASHCVTPALSGELLGVRAGAPVDPSSVHRVGCWPEGWSIACEPEPGAVV